MIEININGLSELIMINSGDTAFVMICTALVCMMTPALALFYGGMVREKNTTTILMQNFICMGVVGLLWVFGGFSLVFGHDIGGVVGNITQYFGLSHIGAKVHPQAPHIPFMLFFAYQMMFAVITPALMTGAFACRFRFGPYLKFLVLWTILVYFPVAHWIWGGGFLAKLGVVDFAGGIVIHTTAGFGAIVCAVFLGHRKLQPGENEKPTNIPMIAMATGLLWFGWFGFNAGGTYAANTQSSYAFLNTFLAGAIAMLVWIFWETRGGKKPNFTGSLVGAVAGLATITPAAGYVDPAAALVIGALGATACFFAKHIQHYFKFDDALEVFRAHGVGGMVGALLIGVFANAAVGGIHAGIHQFLVQLLAIVIVAIYTVVITWVILKFLNSCSPIRVSEQEEMVGLDLVEHDEPAYQRTLYK
ncbi:Ammonium transporter NrgA [Photobacterium kishitanii]|nr:Ammonium transporter NrgA [Photobacterium kishitanii]